MNSRVDEAIDYIRAEYIEGAKISELAEKYNVNINTLYTRRRRECWDLLRDKRLADIAKARNVMMTSIKGQSLGFYNDVLSKCQKCIEGEIAPKDLKIVVETRIMCEDRMFLYAGELLEVEKKEEQNRAEGLLDDIIKDF